MPFNLLLTPVRKSLQKREKALMSFKARKEAFFIAKEQMIKEIEEARAIWKSTLEQRPNLPF